MAAVQSGPVAAAARQGPENDGRAAAPDARNTLWPGTHYHKRVFFSSVGRPGPGAGQSPAVAPRTGISNADVAAAWTCPSTTRPAARPATPRPPLCPAPQPARRLRQVPNSVVTQLPSDLKASVSADTAAAMVDEAAGGLTTATSATNMGRVRHPHGRRSWRHRGGAGGRQALRAARMQSLRRGALNSAAPQPPPHAATLLPTRGPPPRPRPAPAPPRPPLDLPAQTPPHPPPR